VARVKRPDFELGGVRVAAGERRAVQLPVATLYNSSEPMTLPVHVVVGRRDGPRLFVSAALHGDELNGVEIIRRVLRHRSLNRLRGVLVAIPIVNVFGIIQHSRYLPDGRDLNRSFPGSSGGSLAARLASIVLEEIIGRCTHGIDLHTGARHRTNLPQIRGDLDDAETLAMATAFGVPVLINANVRDGSLRQAAAEREIPIVVYEAGEALRFDELSIRAGVVGVLRIMASLEMITRRPRGAVQEPAIARGSSWLRAPASGIFEASVRLGESVTRGDLLGVVRDPTDFFSGTVTPIRTSRDGIVIGSTRLPLVNEGDAVFHIARFDDAEFDDVVSDVVGFREAFAEL